MLFDLSIEFFYHVGRAFNIIDDEMALKLTMFPEMGIGNCHGMSPFDHWYELRALLAIMLTFCLQHQCSSRYSRSQYVQATKPLTQSLQQAAYASTAATAATAATVRNGGESKATGSSSYEDKLVYIKLPYRYRVQRMLT